MKKKASFIKFSFLSDAELVGKAIFATSANPIQVASTVTATDRLGSAFATRIGEEFYAIKVSIQVPFLFPINSFSFPMFFSTHTCVMYSKSITLHIKKIMRAEQMHEKPLFNNPCRGQYFALVQML